jgi:hypothetical protein
MTKKANQGVRQAGKPSVAGTQLLKVGEKFISLRFPNKPEELIIPEGTVGIVHTDAVNEISVLRDDSQVVRRFITRLTKSQ